MLAVSVQWGSVGAGVTAAFAVLAFVIGGVIRPLRRQRSERSELAEHLAIQAAVRNKEIDERINRLLHVTETQDRRIARIEHDLYRPYTQWGSHRIGGSPTETDDS